MKKGGIDGRVRRREPILHLAQQQGPGDCGIACLASITGREYRDVLIHAAAESGPCPHERGLYLCEIMRIAALLGYPMRLKRRCNFFYDKGILDVHRRVGHHVVILMAGLIFDLDDLTVWLPDAYRQSHKATYHSILVPS